MLRMNLRFCESITPESKGNAWPLRKAVDQACKRIIEKLNDKTMVVVFFFPWGCHGES